jgi:hypothetical protein
MVKQGVYLRTASFILVLMLCVQQSDICYAQAARQEFVGQATLQSRIDDQYARSAFAEKLLVEDRVWKTMDPLVQHDVNKFMYCVKTYDIERLLRQENTPQYYSLSVVNETHLETYENRDIALLLDFPDEYVELALRQMPDHTEAYNKSRGSLMRFIHDNVRLNHTNVLYWKKGRYLWPAWNKKIVYFILNKVDKFMRKIDGFLLDIECVLISDLDEMIEYKQTRTPSFAMKIGTAMYALLWTTLLTAEWIFGRSSRGLKKRLVNPETVLSEQNKSSKEVSSFFNNEIVVKNGPKLTVKGVGLIVRANDNYDFMSVLEEFGKYREELTGYLAEHQLPIVLLPEQGADYLELSRELLLYTSPGIHEIRPYTFLLQSPENKTTETYSGKWDDFQHLQSA